MNAIDVLVVGAGPAGTVAATALASAGARVRLVDRARFPRPKLCGDTLNPGAFAVLHEGSHGCSHRDEPQGGARAVAKAWRG